MDVQIPDFPMRAVDYLVYQEYEVFKSSSVRLGVMLADSDGQAGFLITDRVSGSAAEEAGINKGDRLLRFDGVPLEDNFDLIYAVKTLRPGSTATIELKRGDDTLVVEANFGLEQ